jgi:hypothetical protein
LPKTLKYGLLDCIGGDFLMDKKVAKETGFEEGEDVKTKDLVHEFSTNSLKSAFTPKVIAVFGLVIVIGVVSGYLFSGNTSGSGSTKSLDSILSGSSMQKGTVIGSDDTATFKDIVQGVLKEGGSEEGEGAYHLERAGGESQNVYLTSSIVDLSKFINKKIKVWGQTQKAQSAGWLMDVGRIEIL